MPDQDRYLQSEERQKAIVEQKRIFLTGGRVDTSVVSAMILRSWERSRAAKVDPDVKERSRINGDELKGILAENADLMDCAKDILEQMFSSMQEAVSALSLVSAQGVTLYISNRVSHRAYYPDALVGSINTEEARGTNGIGTCLAERQPVEIIGAEHFRFSGECWSCSAAPIFSPDGKLIGVLNVTQPRKQYHTHTLGMVKAAVCAITEQLRLRSLLQQRETIMEMLDDGGLVLSSSGGNSTGRPRVMLRMLPTWSTETIRGSWYSETGTVPSPVRRTLSYRKGIPRVWNTFSRSSPRHRRRNIFSERIGTIDLLLCRIPFFRGCPEGG